MTGAPGGAIQKLAVGILALGLGTGCAWVPEDWFADLFGERRADSARPAPPLPPPLVDCELMTILIDASRQGDAAIAGRARTIMSREFERFGARISPTPEGAYWSLMILASQNSRRDGFILNALLTARTGSESSGPGMTVFSRDGEPPVEAGAEAEAGEDAPEEAAEDAAEGEQGVATLYNGIAFGPHAQLDKQARALTRQAYAAVYPAARRMCEYAAGEQQRERELEEQVPAGPEPL